MLCNPAARVVMELSKHQVLHIRRIQFDGGVFDEQTLHCLPEFNTLISIRGSGKSAILEVIRYTFGSGGTVLLTACDLYGQGFTISRWP